MAFQKEPPFQHGQSAKTAVLYCNLGTPDEPSAPALRRYLAQFLGDSRVVEIPKAIWWLILHGIILRVRPAKSAAKYASIWSAEGSPLRVWTDKQAQGLAASLKQRGHDVLVKYAMTYGKPSIASEIEALRLAGATRILVLPAYPQYSGTTTAPVFDAVYRWSLQTRNLPEFRFVNHYHDNEAYIHALAQRIQTNWDHHGRAEKLVMSFHGVPERTLQLGDPYHCECYKTGRLLAEKLGLQKDQYMVTFQSRFGKAKWLEPYTEPSLIALAQSGTQSVDVVCPGFTGDCLETLEEIGMEAREAFVHAGGKTFNYIPCLNDEPIWMDALAAIAEQHLQGWPTRASDVAQHNAQLLSKRGLALALGAKD